MVKTSKKKCRWFNQLFIDLQLFYFLRRIIPDNWGHCYLKSECHYLYLKNMTEL